MLILIPPRQRCADLSKFKARLVYTASLRPARHTQLGLFMETKTT